jgi:hypothetical protein
MVANTLIKRLLACSVPAQGEPGKIRMRSSNVPVSVWLGPLKLAVYGGVDIEQVCSALACRLSSSVRYVDVALLKFDLLSAFSFYACFRAP